MKRTLALLTCILLTFTLFACGNNSDKVNNNNNNNEKTEETQKQQNNSKTSANRNVLQESYESFRQMKSSFDDLVLEVSEEHNILPINSIGPSEMNILTYILPLSVVGNTIKTTGKFDKDLEIIGLNAAWLNDCDINYEGDGNYQLNGFDRKGNKIDVKIMHDPDKDSTRLVAHNNETLALVFEYVKTDDGYAAQYYYEDTTRFENYQPIVEFCKFMIVFDEKNGTYARFNGVDTEPTSIYSNPPDTSTIAEGATSWFTLTDGQITGNIKGEEF